MSEYIQTREQCQSKIGSLVCSGCGGQLEPMETVDNARRPTFWVGCRHCSCFDQGVHVAIFRTARELVGTRRLRPYTHLAEDDYRYIESQTRGAVSIVSDVLAAAAECGALSREGGSRD